MNLISAAFKGLEPKFYFRHLIFSGLGFLWFLNNQIHSKTGVDAFVLSLFVINFALYPYAHYSVNSAIKFLLGDRQFDIPIIGLFLLKLTQFLVTWWLTILVAPISLVIIGLQAYRSHKYPEKIG